jgi:hypothetical protein
MSTTKERPCDRCQRVFVVSTQNRSTTWRCDECRPLHKLDEQRRYWSENRERLTAAQSRRYRNDVDRHRDYHLRRLYGLTLVEYNELVEIQAGRCKICGRTAEEAKERHGRLHVDHDHQTGVVRGLLCSRCNRTLGLVDEDVTLLVKMMGYLNVD